MLFLFTYLCFQHIPPTLAAPLQSITALNTEIAPSWVDDPSGRGTWNLLYSCVFTLVLCVWTSIHLNVPPPLESFWHEYRRKLRWVFIALFAPEAVVFTAFCQWMTAKVFLKELKRLAAANAIDHSKGGEVVQPKCLFDMVYAHYATMGGFAVNIDHLHNTVSQATLTTNGLLLLAQQGHFFNISRETIADKSKANILAKILVCLQVLWVAGQAIERKVADYPISLLEVHTLVHVVCALIMYALWIRKPYDIKEPTLLPTDSFPELLAFIVSSSKWRSKSGFRLLLDEVPASESEIALFSSKDPRFYYYGNLKDTPRIRVETIGSKQTPISMNDRRIRNHRLRVSRKDTDPRWVKSQDWITAPPELPPDIPFYSANTIRARIGPPQGVEEILVLESGQALESGLGPQTDWYESTNEPSIRVGLSQKDLDRLDMAGMFIKGLLTSETREGNYRLQAGFNHPTFSIPNDQDLNLEPFQPFRAGLLRPYGAHLIRRNQDNWVWSDDVFDILDTFEPSGQVWGIFLILIAMILIPAAYGGIHFGASSCIFPSAIELTLWKASCLTLLGFAALLLLGTCGLLVAFVYLKVLELPPLFGLRDEISFWLKYFLSRIVGFPVLLLCITARVFIVVESFISLRHVPIGVYQTPDANFMSYIPHL